MMVRLNLEIGKKLESFVKVSQIVKEINKLLIGVLIETLVWKKRGERNKTL